MIHRNSGFDSGSGRNLAISAPAGIKGIPAIRVQAQMWQVKLDRFDLRNVRVGISPKIYRRVGDRFGLKLLRSNHKLKNFRALRAQSFAGLTSEFSGEG